MADIKVTDIIVEDDEIASVIDIVSDLNVPEHTKDRIKEEVGAYLIEQTLLSVSDAISPIAGEGWKKSLSKKYKEKKESEGGTPIANLEAKGDMISALDFEKTKDGIKIFISGEEALKADGHNNFSGESDLPKRRFMPGEGQEYKSAIQKGAQEIINDIIAEETIVVKSDFEGIETAAALYKRLADLLGTTSRSEISRSVFGNETLVELLEELDLLDLL